jgi:hypothetical protein
MSPDPGEPLDAYRKRGDPHASWAKSSMQTHAVGSVSDLAALRRVLSPWRFGRRRRVLLLLPELDSGARSHYEQALNRHLRECGCSWGASFALLAFALVIGIQMVTASGFSFSHVLISALLAIAWMVPAGVLGKLAGILRAHRRFQRTCLELQGVLARCQSPSA